MIQKELDVPVINMIAEAAKVCVEHGYTKVGILATTGTCNTHTYDKELQKFGIKSIYPDEEGQKKVMEIIYDQVKAGKKIDASIIDQTLKKMAAEKGVAPNVLQLAWMLHSWRFADRPQIVPLFSASTMEHLQENLSAADVALTTEEAALLNNA